MLRKVSLLICITRFVDSEKMEPFIVGGKPAHIGNFGYSAYVTVETNKQSCICGASILNQNIILTAGHCFEAFNANSKIPIRAGSANKLSGSLRYGTRLAVHGAYNQFTIENDIALVYIKVPFIFNEHIKRVIIMKKPPSSKVGYVAGWGLVNDKTATDSDWLYHAKQALRPRDECSKLLKRLPKGVLCGGAKHSEEYAADNRRLDSVYYSILLSRPQFSTLNSLYQVNAPTRFMLAAYGKGDSGSALVVDGSVQVGLVSFKRPEISRSIVVYTDVAYFYSWITATAQRLHCSQPS